jgi:hypothetical protein
MFHVAAFYFLQKFAVKWHLQTTLTLDAKPAAQFHKTMIAQAVAQTNYGENAAFSPKFFEQPADSQPFLNRGGEPGHVITVAVDVEASVGNTVSISSAMALSSSRRVLSRCFITI